MTARRDRMITVADVVARFSAETVVGQRNPLRSTLTRLAKSQADGGLGDVALAEINTELVHGWLADVRPSGMRSARSALMQVFRFASDAGQMTTARAEELGHVHVGDNARAIETFTLGELDLIAPCLPDDLVALPRFGVATGLRPGELAALQWDDLSLGQEPVVHVRRTLTGARGVGEPKFSRTEGWRSVPLCDLALEVLDKHSTRAGRDFVFGRIAADGVERLRTTQQLGNRWRDACRRARVRYRSLYDLRRTFVVENVRQGVPLQTLADWLGISAMAVRELGIPLDTRGWVPWPHYRRH